MAAGVGGSPVRSKDTRRSQVSRGASGDGFQPFASSAASTNRSTSPRAQPLAATAGSAGVAGGMNAQCGFHSAPCSIQRISVAFSTSSSVRCESAAGIITLGSVLVMRRTSSLLDVLPGTMARWPDSSVASADACTSSRSPPLRCRSSGPWHLKQRSDRSGLTWKLKSTRSGTPAIGGACRRQAPLPSPKLRETAQRTPAAQRPPARRRGECTVRALSAYRRAAATRRLVSRLRLLTE